MPPAAACQLQVAENRFETGDKLAGANLVRIRRQPESLFGSRERCFDDNLGPGHRGTVNADHHQLHWIDLANPRQVRIRARPNIQGSRMHQGLAGPSLGLPRQILDRGHRGHRMRNRQLRLRQDRHAMPTPDIKMPVQANRTRPIRRRTRSTWVRFRTRAATGTTG